MTAVMASVLAGISRAVRSAGAALERAGLSLEGGNVDKLQPAIRVMKLGKATPTIGSGAFVAPTASVIGNVKLGADSSVWYGAVVRGDVNSITVGDRVSIGDRAMVHCSGISANKPTVIGNGVVIGAGAIVHGCTLEDESLVGEGAQVLDGAWVAKHAIVAPGAVVGQGKVVASGQLWAGVPAAYVRDLSPAERAAIPAAAANSQAWAAKHAEEAAKPWEIAHADLDAYEQTVGRNEYYYRRLTTAQMQYKLGEVESHDVPGRILDSPIRAR